MNFNVMLVAIPLFFLLILIEYLVAKHQQKEVYRLNDTLANLNIGIGNQVFSVLSKGFIFGIIYFVYERFAFFKIDISIVSVLAVFVFVRFHLLLGASLGTRN
jgi:alkylglycerol monooxygenase